MFFLKRFRKKRPTKPEFEDVFFIKIIPLNVRSQPFIYSAVMVIGFLLLDVAYFGGGVTVITYLAWMVAFFVAWFILVKINILHYMGRTLYYVARWNVFKFFNLLPGIDSGDFWVVEEYGEPIDLSSRKHWVRFMKRKSFDFFILFPGTFAFLMRIFIWLIDKDGNVSELSIVLGIFLFPLAYFLLMIPIWIIEDSGIKIVEKRAIIYQEFDDENLFSTSMETIEDVTTLGRVFRRLVTYFVGIPSLFWFADRVIQASKEQVSGNRVLDPIVQYATNVVGATIVIFIIIVAGFPLLYLSTILYYNKYHEKYVNDLRVSALEGIKAARESSVIIGTLTLKTLITADTQSYIKHVEGLKNRILQKWRALT